MPALPLRIFLIAFLGISLGTHLSLGQNQAVWLQVEEALTEKGLQTGAPGFTCAGDPLDAFNLPTSPGLPVLTNCKDLVWCVLPLQNLSEDSLTFYSHCNYFPRLLWVLSENGQLVYQEKGGLEPPLPKGKPVETRHHFRIVLPPHASRTLWLSLPYPPSEPLPENFHLQLKGEASVYTTAYRDYFDRRGFVGMYFSAQAIMAFQLLFALVLWSLARQPAYLYYGLYILSLIGVFYLQYTDYLFMPRPEWLGAERYYVPALSTTFIAIFLYMRFGRSFLQLDSRAPREAAWARKVEWATLIFILFFILLTPWPPVQTMVYSCFSITLFGFAVLTAGRLAGKRLPLGVPFLFGSSALVLGAFLNFLLGILDRNFDWQPPVEGLNFMLLGVMVELVFFSAALAWKLRLDERSAHQTREDLLLQYQENARLSIQMSTMRERIASDLHDEIGGTLSSMGIYSEVARKELANPEKVIPILDKITRQAGEMLAEMRDTVWALAPRNDSAGALLQRMKDTTASLLAPKGILYEFITGPEAEAPPLDLGQRQHLLRWYKEVLHNLVRHSRCSHARIFFGNVPNGLCLEVEDDGVGFDPAEVRQGTGLHSLTSRARALGAQYHVYAAPGKGVRHRLLIPLPQNGDGPSS